MATINILSIKIEKEVLACAPSKEPITIPQMGPIECKGRLKYLSYDEETELAQFEMVGHWSTEEIDIIADFGKDFNFKQIES